MKKLRHWSASLLCLLALASSGCIGVPNLSRNHGRTLARQVGPADSNKPFRIGRTSRDEVVKLLGEPHCRTQHGVAVGYRHEVITSYWFGYVLGGPCSVHPGGPVSKTECFFLEFDPAGVLKRVEAHNNELWSTFIAPTQDSDDPEFKKSREDAKPVEW